MTFDKSIIGKTIAICTIFLVIGVYLFSLRYLIGVLDLMFLNALEETNIETQMELLNGVWTGIIGIVGVTIGASIYTAIMGVAIFSSN